MNINKTSSQDLNLEDYHWHNRVVLIIANEGNNIEYERQIQELRESSIELKERRMVLIEVQKGKYRLINSQGKEAGKQDWQISNELYKKYSGGNDDFRIILIGLDGGIKINKKEVVSRKELFGKIDAMPMRRAELENKYDKKDG